MSVRTIVKSIQDIMRQDTGVDGEVSFISADLTPRNFKSRLIQPEDFAGHDLREPR